MKCLSLGMYMIDHYYVIAYFKTRQGGRKDFEFVHNMSKFSSQEVESVTWFFGIAEFKF